MAGGSCKLRGGRNGRGGGRKRGRGADYSSSASSVADTSSKPRLKTGYADDNMVESGCGAAALCGGTTSSEEMETVTSSILISNVELERMLAKAREEGRDEAWAEFKHKLDDLECKMNWTQETVQVLLKLMGKPPVNFSPDAPPTVDGKDLGKD